MALTIVDDFSPIKVTGTTDTKAKIIEPSGGIIFIKHIIWFNPTLAGDLCILTDKYENEIIRMRCETDGISQWWPINTVYNSVYCTDLDSGTLLIYH